MQRKRDFKTFGSFLRNARKERRLTLKEVAAAARDVARDPEGRISHPHLSQIENGRPIGIAVAKVLTLAALYLRGPNEIIAQAPEELRLRLTSDLAKWEREGRREPAPVRYLPRTVREVDGALDGMLESKAESVRIPLGDEVNARRLIRRAVVSAALVPYMVSEACDLAREFWKTDVAAETSTYVPDGFYWFNTVDNFVEWLLYDRRLLTDLLAPVRAWTIDFDQVIDRAEGTELLGCSFADAAVEREYGFQHTPVAALRAVRWRQAAQLLSRTDPPARLGALEPPDPVEGVYDYVARMMSPFAGACDDPGVSPADFIAWLDELRAQVPALRSKRKAKPNVALDAIGALLNSAARGRRR